jgi:hypothetical protein
VERDVNLVFRRHSGVIARKDLEQKRRSAAFETAQAAHVLGWRNSKPPAELNDY